MANPDGRRLSALEETLLQDSQTIESIVESVVRDHTSEFQATLKDFDVPGKVRDHLEQSIILSDSSPNEIEKAMNRVRMVTMLIIEGVAAGQGIISNSRIKARSSHPQTSHTRRRPPTSPS